MEPIVAAEISAADAFYRSAEPGDEHRRLDVTGRVHFFTARSQMQRIQTRPIVDLRVDSYYHGTRGEHPAGTAK